MRELRVRYTANRRYFPEGKRAEKKPASLLAHTVGSDVDHKRKRTEGRIEFTTQTDSYKVKRVRCNPRVVCPIGSKEGPTISGTAEIVTDKVAVWRGYRANWKIHPLMILFLACGIRRRIKTGRSILIRVHPDEPNPLSGVTDPLV